MSLKGDKPLALKLPTDDGDARTREVITRLQALLAGTTTPSQAAHDLNAWVVREAEQRLPSFKTRTGQARYDVTPEESSRGIDDIRAVGPYPEGIVNRLFEAIAKICSSFPPFHPSQNLIIDFLKALRAIPVQEVPHVTPIWRLNRSGPDAPGWDMMKLWPFEDEKEDLAGLTEPHFREEAESKCRVATHDFALESAVSKPTHIPLQKSTPTTTPTSRPSPASSASAGATSSPFARASPSPGSSTAPTSARCATSCSRAASTRTSRRARSAV